jgi:hypothetical protein
LIQQDLLIELFGARTQSLPIFNDDQNKTSGGGISQQKLKKKIIINVFKINHTNYKYLNIK